QGLQLPALEALRDQLAAAATAALRAAGDLGPQQQPRLELRLELRYPGSERGLEVSWPQQHGGPEALVAALQRQFVDLHRLRYGYVPADQQLVVERLLVEAAVDTALEGAVEEAVDPALQGALFGAFHNAHPGCLDQDLSSRAAHHASQADNHGPMAERLVCQSFAQPHGSAQQPRSAQPPAQLGGQQLSTTPVWMPQPAVLEPARQQPPPA
ncbi:MAG TPA: hypothetical protein DDY43_06350, partial [Synechococcales bacterium UBA10510]|nr:hypothetical protein [Synechococcales bacterium UBA10510]